jgi:hypothetical protein
MTELTHEDVTIHELKLSKIQINEELDTKMEQYFNDIVIPEIQAFSRSLNLPEDFVRGFEFVKTGRNRGKIINTFGSKELPLAKFFNYGTKRGYEITPKVQHPTGALRASRDKDSVGEEHVQHPTVLHWVDQSGRDVFLPSTTHPGFAKTMAMENGYSQAIKNLIPVISNDLKQKFGGSGEITI